ncbi:hypothetical protein ACP4OV_007251 [Aristida adscensionis]
MGVLEFGPGAGGPPAFGSVAVNDVLCDGTGRAKVFMLECDGELYMACLWLPRAAAARQASVYRMDFSEQRWRLVEDVGDNAFFVAPFNFAASCAAGKYGIRKNCIYSADPLAEKSVKAFDIADGTAQVHSLEDFLPGEIDRSLWIMPN